MLRLILFSYCLVVGVSGSRQFVRVSGSATCFGGAVPAGKVKLFDVDRLPGDADDLMGGGLIHNDTAETPSTFFTQGFADEFTVIEPQLRIYHRCDFAGPPNCWRRFVHDVPQQYVFEDESSPTEYKTSTFELSHGQENEKVVCNKQV